MELLTLGESGATPWSFSPVWLVVVALLVPAAAWVAFAWRRAFEEDPMRMRRSGIREMRRLLHGLRRSRSAPQSRHLHAWMRATARTWGVRASAPTSAEVVKACHAITSDASTVTRWRELWQVTERGLFAPNAKAPQDWVDRASNAAGDVQMPKRERKYPNRRSHWLPSLVAAAVVTLAAALPGASRADVPMSSDDYANQPTPAESPADSSASARGSRPSSSAATSDGPPSAESSPTAGAVSPPAGAEPAPLSREQMLDAQKSARDALAKNWNDWAAHHNMAALGIESENWNIAIAYATASFLQHPSSTVTRETLRLALEQTQTADEHLRAMVSGSWYQRIPALFSAAGWQRLSIASGLLLALALTALVASLYVSDRIEHKRRIVWVSRGSVAVGVIALSLSVVGWKGYGLMNQPQAAILLENVNVSPAPTDLVPVNETSPAAAGSIVLTQRTFLGWQQIRIDGRPSGWVRRNAVMPIYAKRT
jgi:hypothetical protein